MKKIIFVLFFCVSPGLFSTTDSKVQGQGLPALQCWYTGWVLDRCSFADYSIIGCQRGYLTSCGFNPPTPN